MAGVYPIAPSGSSIKLAALPLWFAIQVKTTHEKRVTGHLEWQGHEWFLPLYSCRRRWSDRVKQVELPLFPGYVFCRFAPADRVPILKIPSVMQIVGIGYTPTPIDDAEMATIQRVVKAGVGVSPHPYLQVGRRVQIASGSLYGLEGIIADVRRRDRLILSVSLLQRSIAVEIDSACVVPIHTSKKKVENTPIVKISESASRFSA
jgi:transcriptional antiterminator NusG